MKTLYETAVELHSKGFHIIPVDGKVPAKNCGKWKELNETKDDIERWFKNPSTPVTGIGLRLHNLIAIDIDTYNGQVVGNLCDGAGAVSSGRGTTVLWMSPPRLRLKTNTKGTNCEIKTGRGAYIVIPPSMHKTKGAPYEWTVGQGPWDAKELPLTLIAQLQSNIDGPASSRHAQLLSYAVKLRKEGKNVEEILKGLQKYNEHLAKPKTEKEDDLPAIAAWAYKKVANVNVNPMLLREEFVRMYQGQLFYVTDIGRECWRAWNGHYWEEYGLGKFKGLVLHCVDQVRELAKTTAYKPFWASSLANWAPGETSLHTKEEIFDKQLDALNCKNLTWSASEVYEPRQTDYITRCVQVNYLKDRLNALKGSKWGKFLYDTCSNSVGELDSSLLHYLQLAVGYSVFGSNELQIIFFVYGKPNTGKSTFLEAIRSVLGDYAHTMRANAILKSQFQQHNTPEIAALEGKRLVVASEIPKNVKLDEQLLKNLTGDEAISAMAKYKAPKQIQLEAKFWIAGNDLPSFSYDDLGIKKRIKVVPFVNIVPQEKIDATLRSTFNYDEFEREIILAWVLEGARLYAHGARLNEPQCVLDETEIYFNKQDDVGMALMEITEKGDEHSVVGSELYRAVAMYLLANHKHAVTPTKLGQKLSKRGYRKGTSRVDGKQVRTWFGLRLKESKQMMVD